MSLPGMTRLQTSAKIPPVSASQERIRSDFATVASHQLRTPISAIRWALDMVLSGRSGRLTRQQREYLERAYQQNAFMARIVGDLLRISRIEAGDVAITPTAVNLAALIGRVVKDSAMLARAYNCRVRVALPPRLSPLTTDALKLREVMQILVDNAVRYGRREGRVTVRARRVGDRVELMVQDRGMGIPLRQQKNIFTKFFRTENAIHSQTEGLGVELYIAQHYVWAMGGTIRFRSRYRRGTTFTVTLPVRNAGRLASAAASFPFVVSAAVLRFVAVVSEAVAVTDPAFRLVHANPAAVRLFGLMGETVRGHALTDLVRARALEQLLRRRPNGEEVLTVRLRLPGESRIGAYEIRLIPLHQQDVISGWLTVIAPSESKTLSRAGMEARLRREREFVTITVHELNAPLGVSKWSLELLRREIIGSLNVEQRRLLDQVYRHNERLLTLVRDLLNLSKLEEGKFTVTPQATDAAAVVRDVGRSFQPAANARSLTLRLPPRRGLPRALADPARLRQVVTNLLSNAVKYTPAGGRITLALRTYSLAAFQRYLRQRQIAAAHVDAPRGYVVVSVTDTGIGIAPAQLGNVFTKFFRTRAALKLRVEGTGLGLYIARAIVELHQGDIWCQSVPGKGSTFSFSLPVA